MKPAAIKKLVENNELEALQKAEEELMEEKTPSVEVDGSDEGEQLTHILAAVWIKQQMQKNNSDLKTELRNYTQRVRTSIN